MTMESKLTLNAKGTVGHYENFPVASLLLPARLRPAVRSIYAFARSADDLADEGNLACEERLAALSAYADRLTLIEQGLPVDDPLFENLAATVAAFALPLQPFRDLLSAFRQDVSVTRYANAAALLDYCRRSANPVGILMLHLYGKVDERNLRDSDAICSALQLINFWQDVALDWAKGRVYIPQDDIARFGVGDYHFEQQRVDDAWRNLMRHQVRQTRALMLSGASLACRLPGRVGWELRFIVQGGLRVLKQIESVDYDVFRRRPELRARDWFAIAVRSARMR